MISKGIEKRALYSRSVVPQIVKWIDDRQAIVLVGSRQVGKTSVLFLLIQHLLAQGVSPQNLFYFDLENFDHLNLLEKGPQALIPSLRLEGADFSNRIYLFVDEIQYLQKPSNFLKLLVDHYPPTAHVSDPNIPGVKLICTGSSTLDIRRKFQDSLVGRKIVFEIFSLSFEEFLQFKGDDTLLKLIRDYSLRTLLEENKTVPPPPEIYLDPLQARFDDYVRYGGYPAVVLEPESEKKLILLTEIHNAYVRKDLSSLFTIENIQAFNQLIQLLALGSGSLVNLNTLTTDLGISRPTLSNYLTILENTFIIKRLSPLFRRKKREVIKMPKAYFLDLGLRNLVVKQFGELATRPDRGALVENFSFIHLYRNLSPLQELNFWRTKQGTEVDFVVQTPDHFLAIEVKYEAMRKASLPSGLRSFLAAYPSGQAAVITRSHFAQIKHNETRVVFLPAWLFISDFGFYQ